MLNRILNICPLCYNISLNYYYYLFNLNTNRLINLPTCKGVVLINYDFI